MLVLDYSWILFEDNKVLPVYYNNNDCQSSKLPLSLPHRFSSKINVVFPSIVLGLWHSHHFQSWVSDDVTHLHTYTHEHGSLIPRVQRLRKTTSFFLSKFRTMHGPLI